jgi:hypothetical protein
MSSLTFAPLGSFSEYSTSACDRVLHFDGSGGMPAEIAALGEAEAIYEPNQIAYKLAGWRHLLAFLVVAVIGGLIALVFVGLAQRGELDQLADPTVWVAFGIIGATAVGVAIWLTTLKRTTATVFFYRQAAVVAEENRLSLIPWQHLLWLPGKILTDDGSTFYCGWMQDHDRFEEAIWAHSDEFWVPAALKKIQAGQTVTCGDLGISGSGITWKGKTASWEDVSRLVIVVGRWYRMNIATSGSWIEWASIDLYQVPNARAIERLISHVAPPRLLKSGE